MAALFGPTRAVECNVHAFGTVRGLLGSLRQFVFVFVMVMVTAMMAECL
jgi:hypothetical protein